MKNGDVSMRQESNCIRSQTDVVSFKFWHCAGKFFTFLFSLAPGCHLFSLSLTPPSMDDTWLKRQNTTAPDTCRYLAGCHRCMNRNPFPCLLFGNWVIETGFRLSFPPLWFQLYSAGWLPEFNSMSTWLMLLNNFMIKQI